MDISNKSVEDSRKLQDRNYVRWDEEGVEKIPEGEAEDIQAVADQINAIQKAQYNSHRHCYTGERLVEILLLRGLLTKAGTHARTQGVVKGTLVVERNLPPHLKQSMFAEERGWPVLCRYSSEPSDPGLDVSALATSSMTTPNIRRIASLNLEALP